MESPYAEIVGRYLDDIERGTVAKLEAMGWPIEPADIYLRLAALPENMTADGRRERQRARLAMFILRWAGNVRHQLRPSAEPSDVAGAIHDALHLGMLSVNLGLKIVMDRGRRAIARKPRLKRRRKQQRKRTSLLSKYHAELAKNPRESVRKIASRLVKRGRDYSDLAGKPAAVNRKAKQILRALNSKKTGH